MRFGPIVVIAAGVLCANPAMALENFIPLGQPYTPESSSLPEMSSRQDQINIQADIYETEVYSKLRAKQVQDSYMNRFYNAQEIRGSDYFIDY